jgi:hypothetical protein
MCGCRRNKGSVEKALAVSTPAPRIRGRAVPAPPVSRPVVQKRMVTEYKIVMTRKPDSKNPRRILSVRERLPVVVERPLETKDTKLWGAALWRILHVLSIRGVATEAGRSAWSALPKELDGALPCPECAQHYHDWLRAHPLTATDGDSVRDWVLALHNQVNERKSVPVWTAEQVTATYGGLTAADATAALTGIRELIGVGGLRALESLIALSAATE